MQVFFQNLARLFRHHFFLEVTFFTASFTADVVSAAVSLTLFTALVTVFSAVFSADLISAFCFIFLSGVFGIDAFDLDFGIFALDLFVVLLFPDAVFTIFLSSFVLFWCF